MMILGIELYSLGKLLEDIWLSVISYVLTGNKSAETIALYSYQVSLKKKCFAWERCIS